MDRAEIALALAELGVEPYRARQIHGWIYARGAVDFATMTNLSQDLRVRLAGRFRIDRPRVASHQVSADGPPKWLLRFADGHEAEAVQDRKIVWGGKRGNG